MAHIYTISCKAVKQYISKGLIILSFHCCLHCLLPLPYFASAAAIYHQPPPPSAAAAMPDPGAADPPNLQAHAHTQLGLSRQLKQTSHVPPHPCCGGGGYNVRFHEEQLAKAQAGEDVMTPGGWPHRNWGRWHLPASSWGARWMRSQGGYRTSSTCCTFWASHHGRVARGSALRRRTTTTTAQ